MNHTWVMLIACLLSGMGSTMNVWADKWSDVRWSLNDVYMTGLMTGWMFLFMGMLLRDMSYILWGGIAVGVFFLCIRTQWGVNPSQYINGMIPHHSMAVLMSRRLQERPNHIGPFLEELITTQEREIAWMKRKSSM